MGRRRGPRRAITRNGWPYSSRPISFIASYCLVIACHTTKRESVSQALLVNGKPQQEKQCKPGPTPRNNQQFAPQIPVSFCSITTVGNRRTRTPYTIATLHPVPRDSGLHSIGLANRPGQDTGPGNIGEQIVATPYGSQCIRCNTDPGCISTPIPKRLVGG
ncbi:hypothetical protein V8C43DRAFT_317603 [Trichoderma afarasin]